MPVLKQSYYERTIDTHSRSKTPSLSQLYQSNTICHVLCQCRLLGLSFHLFGSSLMIYPINSTFLTKNYITLDGYACAYTAGTEQTWPTVKEPCHSYYLLHSGVIGFRLPRSVLQRRKVMIYPLTYFQLQGNNFGTLDGYTLTYKLREKTEHSLGASWSYGRLLHSSLVWCVVVCSEVFNIDAQLLLFITVGCQPTACYIRWANAICFIWCS